MSASVRENASVPGAMPLALPTYVSTREPSLARRVMLLAAAGLAWLGVYLSLPTVAA